MKKISILLILILIGCTNKTTLNCNYTDYTNTFGTRKITDKVTFTNNKMTTFTRNITITLYNNKDIKRAIKNIKLEGKTFKKTIGGKYKIKKEENKITLILNTNKNDNLKIIGINTSDNYDDTKANYKDLGFSCK